MRLCSVRHWRRPSCLFMCAGHFAAGAARTASGEACPVPDTSLLQILSSVPTGRGRYRDLCGRRIAPFFLPGEVNRCQSSDVTRCRHTSRAQSTDTLRGKTPALEQSLSQGHRVGGRLYQQRSPRQKPDYRRHPRARVRKQPIDFSRRDPHPDRPAEAIPKGLCECRNPYGCADPNDDNQL